MAYFARISDPAVGGTYMTLLNTLSNLGGNWPTTLVLWLVDVLTWRQCNSLGDTEIDLSNNTCSNTLEREACSATGGKCDIRIDGYYIECLICLIYGIFWYKWGKTKINYLQSLPNRVWYVVKRTNRSNDNNSR